MDWESLTIEEEELTQTPCDCCAGKTNEAVGNILSSENYIAWYVARWGDGHPEIPMRLTVFTGDWSENASPKSRWATRVIVQTEPETGCTLDDWSLEDRQRISSCTLLDRGDVIDSKYAKELWACVDAALMKDTRIQGYL